MQINVRFLSKIPPKQPKAGDQIALTIDKERADDGIVLKYEEGATDSIRL